MPSHPFSSDIFEKNLGYTFDDISVQIAHAQDVSGRARTGYYRVAILLAASCVEATLYEYITKACTQNPTVLQRVRKFNSKRGVTTLVKLPKSELGTTKELWICEIERTLVDRTTSFREMNDFALEARLISPKLHKSLEYVRKKRNDIHFQTLQTTERHYNGQMLERVASVFLRVLSKLEKL